MNLLESLVDDHRRYQAALSKISRVLFGAEDGYFIEGRKPQTTASVLVLLKNMFHDMRRHEIRESRLLFPWLLREAALPRKLLRSLDAEHDETKRLLNAFQRAIAPGNNASNRSIIARFLRFMNHMNKHMQREEQELFSLVRTHLPSGRLEKDWKDLDANKQPKEACHAG